jgi:acyl-CoA synthetase (NDP forming)
MVSYGLTAKLLEAYGISLAPSVMAASVQEAVCAADQLGYPCVLKVTSVDIAHKTEFGALRLNLENSISVRHAYDEMLAGVRAAKPEAKIEGVLVQKQLRGVFPGHLA